MHHNPNTPDPAVATQVTVKHRVSAGQGLFTCAVLGTTLVYMRELRGQHPDFWPDKDQANCKNAPARDLFFPERKNKKLEQRALSYCNGDSKNDMPPCPLKEKCLEWALYSDESGIWGGMTEVQRKYRLSTYGRLVI